MKKDIAMRIMDSLMESYAVLKKAGAIAEEIEDAEERVNVMKGMLLAAGEIEDGPILQIVKQYPDLNPFTKEPGA